MFLETKGWHPGLTSDTATDAKTIAEIRNYWECGESANAIATKCGVSRTTVMRYIEGLPEQEKRGPLSVVEIAGLFRGW